MALRSAQMQSPREAFSTLQPQKTSSLSPLVSSAAPTLNLE